MMLDNSFIKAIKPQFFIWVILFAAAACQTEDTSWKRVQEAGVLKVGVDPTYPPFAVASDATIYGLDVDLANAIAKELGLQTEFVLFGYDGLYDALDTKQVDVLISALVIIPEKTRDFAYSDPYFNAGEILIVPAANVPAANADITDMADLNGRTLAVELGAQGHVEALTWAKNLPDLTVIPYTTADDAMTAVSTAEADAALVDAISGRLFIMNAPGLKQLTNSVTVEPFAFVVRIEDERLLEELNTTLTHLQNTGQFEEIEKRWLGE